MPQPLGASFAPTFDNARQIRPTTGGTAPSSQALQVLSYNLQPRVAGAPGLSPVQGQRRAGSSMGQAVLESVLKTVLGPDAAVAIGQQAESSSPFGGPMTDPGIGAMTAGQAPNPVIHPGGEGAPRRGPEDPMGTPRGTEDPSAAGLQKWITDEMSRRMAAASLPPSFQAGMLPGAGGYQPTWMGSR